MKTNTMTGAFILAGIGFFTTANAAPAATEEQPPFDWSGAYAGIHIGYGWGDSDFTDSEYNGAPPYPTVGWGVDSDGLITGINAGYNWQRDHMIFGLEGEIGRLNLSGSTAQPGTDPYGIPYDASGTVDKGWYGGLSARLGYAWDRTLLYAKAGVLYSNARSGFKDTCTAGPCGNSTASASKRIGWGYQLGAGVEHAMTKRWTIKAEYAYLDFGTTTISGNIIGGAFGGKPYDIRSDLSMHTVKIGLNYQF